MSRQIVLDTETTGLTVADGHRIIEIGCLEIVNRRPTGRHLHVYVNPGREIDEGAVVVHGITLDKLQDKPKFADICDELLAFVADAEVIIHNAPFDVAFLDQELSLIGRGRFAECCASITDSLALAREMHPGKRNSLDMLCDRYGVSNAHRQLHGALLDAELLAEVYLAMTRGQDTLTISLSASDTADDGSDGEAWPPAGLIVVRATEDEIRDHAAMLAAIGREARKPPLWATLAERAEAPTAG